MASDRWSMLMPLDSRGVNRRGLRFTHFVQVMSYGQQYPRVSILENTRNGSHQSRLQKQGWGFQIKKAKEPSIYRLNTSLQKSTVLTVMIMIIYINRVLGSYDRQVK